MTEKLRILGCLHPQYFRSPEATELADWTPFIRISLVLTAALGGNCTRTSHLCNMVFHAIIGPAIQQFGMTNALQGWNLVLDGEVDLSYTIADLQDLYYIHVAWHQGSMHRVADFYRWFNNRGGAIYVPM